MRGAPCCMVRITCAPSIFSNHWAVASGFVLRRWMWSQVKLAIAGLRVLPGSTIRPWRRRCQQPNSSPDFSRAIDNEPQLRPLVRLGQRIAGSGAGKAALRADGEAVEVDMLCGGVGLTLELVAAFEPRRLAAHQ